MKKIHGASKTLWEKFGLNEFPPVECAYKVGDHVVFTNENGVSFEMDIIGFAKDDSFYGRFIHLIRSGTDGSGSAWWFPCAPKEIYLKQ